MKVSQQKRRYRIHSARRVPVITFIRYVHHQMSGKPNSSKVFRSR